MVRHYDSIESKEDFFCQDDYDVLFFGTSHVRQGVSPFFLFSEYGILSYNLSHSSQDIGYSCYNLKNALDYCKPKIAVLDVYSCRLEFPDCDEEIRSHLMFDEYPFSLTKMQTILDFYERSKLKDLRDELIFPYRLYHSRWSEVGFSPIDAWNRKTVFPNRETKTLGFDCRFGLEKNVDDYRNMRLCSDDECLENENSDGIKYIEKFCSLCKENGIQPVLIYLPPASGVLQQKEANSVRKLSERLGVPYCNLLFVDGLIDDDTDFYNCNIGTEDVFPDTMSNGNCHLNLSGARKVTSHIGKILRDDFDLPDRRGEVAYSHWNEDYLVFRKYAFDCAPRTFDELLVACNFPDVSTRLFVRDGVVFDDVERKLIAMLGETISVLPLEEESEKEDVRLVITDDLTGKVLVQEKFRFLKSPNRFAPK